MSVLTGCDWTDAEHGGAARGGAAGDRDAAAEVRRRTRRPRGRPGRCRAGRGSRRVRAVAVDHERRHLRRRAEAALLDRPGRLPGRAAEVGGVEHDPGDPLTRVRAPPCELDLLGERREVRRARVGGGRADRGARQGDVAAADEHDLAGAGPCDDLRGQPVVGAEHLQRRGGGEHLHDARGPRRRRAPAVEQHLAGAGVRSPAPGSCGGAGRSRPWRPSRSARRPRPSSWGSRSGVAVTVGAAARSRARAAQRRRRRRRAPDRRARSPRPSPAATRPATTTPPEAARAVRLRMPARVRAPNGGGRVTPPTPRADGAVARASWGSGAAHADRLHSSGHRAALAQSVERFTRNE